MNVTLAPEDLEMLVEQISKRVIEQIGSGNQSAPDDLQTFTEEQAAKRMNLNTHQLRDERRRGNIKACEVVGKRIRYLPEQIRDYLKSRPYKPNSAANA